MRPACPPLRRIALGIREGWQEDERDHIVRCKECQNCIRLYWKANQTHPSVWDVFRVVCLGSCFEMGRAVDLHIKLEDCGRCRLLSQHPWMVKAADLVLSGGRTLEWARDVMRGLVSLYVAGSQLRLEMQSEGTYVPGIDHAVNMERSLSAVVEEKKEEQKDRLVLDVNSPGAGEPGADLRFDVLTESGSRFSGSCSYAKRVRLDKPVADCLILVSKDIPELSSAEMEDET